MTKEWKVGDWVVYGRDIGQIKEIRGNITVFGDGFFETSGQRLSDGFRPLTLRNKRAAETFEIYYNRLREINGNGGFNFPDISRYFSQLVLDAIDGDENDDTPYKKGQKFVEDAREYKPYIDGVPLFQPFH